MTIEEIKKAKQILLVTPDQMFLDHVVSTITLAEALTKLGKNVRILSNSNLYKKHFKEDFPERITKLENIITSNNYETLFPNDKEIKDIKVEKNSKGFRVIVETKSGNLRTATTNFKKEMVKFDLIILIGFTKYNNSKEFFKSNGNKFSKAPILLFHYGASEVKSNFRYIVNSSSLSEVTTGLIKEQNIEIDSDLATYLISGILDNTQNLRINTNAHTISSINDLICTFKGNFDKARELVSKFHGEVNSIWYQLVFENLKVEKNFAYSYIQDERITSETIGELRQEDKVPLSRLTNNSVSLILINLGKTLHGFLSVNDPNLSALEFTQGFFRVGDRRFVQFWTKEKKSLIIEYFREELGITKEYFADQKQKQSFVGINLIKESTGFTPKPGLDMNLNSKHQTPNIKENTSSLIQNDQQSIENKKVRSKELEEKNENQNSKTDIQDSLLEQTDQKESQNERKLEELLLETKNNVSFEENKSANSLEPNSTKEIKIESSSNKIAQIESLLLDDKLVTKQNTLAQLAPDQIGKESLTENASIQVQSKPSEKEQEAIDPLPQVSYTPQI